MNIVTFGCHENYNFYAFKKKITNVGTSMFFNVFNTYTQYLTSLSFHGSNMHEAMELLVLTVQVVIRIKYVFLSLHMWKPQSYD